MNKSKPVKRKPLDDFWREIGIVTLGVLIALRRDIPVLWSDYFPTERRTRAGIAQALREWGACPTSKIDGKPFRATA